VDVRHYDCAVKAPSLPPGFGESRLATAAELDALPAITHSAVHELEGCIQEHHVADVDYTDAKGMSSTIAFRPAYIRYNQAGNLVVWGMPVGVEHWEELRLDRIEAVRDSGEVFEPTW
jgi:hypothetical protein